MVRQDNLNSTKHFFAFFFPHFDLNPSFFSFSCFQTESKLIKLLSTTAYVAAAASAFDPNASAFTVPAIENDQTAVPEGILITEPPLRSDLFIILGGMWYVKFLRKL